MGASSSLNLAKASVMTCSVVMFHDTGIVSELVEGGTWSLRAQTLITPLSCSLSLKGGKAS